MKKKRWLRVAKMINDLRLELKKEIPYEPMEAGDHDNDGYDDTVDENSKLIPPDTGYEMKDISKTSTSRYKTYDHPGEKIPVLPDVGETSFGGEFNPFISGEGLVDTVNREMVVTWEKIMKNIL